MIKKKLEIQVKELIDSALADKPVKYSWVDFCALIQELPISPQESLALELVDSVSTQIIIERSDVLHYIFYIPALNAARSMRLSTGVDEGGTGAVTNVPNLITEENFRQIMIVIAQFLRLANQRRQYPFIVTVPKIQTVKNKAKLRKYERVHNTVVYLGKPPVNAKGTGDGTKHEFGYPRVSFRRTLKHERYRNHPKFQIYKGVWVRQTWCGPKEYRDGIRIYRLWEPSGVDAVGGDND